MRTQPIENGSTMPTQVLPMMPTVGVQREDGATEKRTHKDRSSPRRESENNAAELSAEAAGCPQGLKFQYCTARLMSVSGVGLDRDFAVDELAVVYPILNAIFDPIPIVAEETDCFVRGRIG